MEKLKNLEKYIPLIGYLGFFLLQTILGILLIAGAFSESSGEGLPLYEPLTFIDLLILFSFNIPAFIVIGIAIKKIRKET